MTKEDSKASGELIDQTIKKFLDDNLLSEQDWIDSGCIWSELEAIKSDYLDRTEELNKTAEFCAGIIQKIPDVHSVRWRVKDVDHVLKKIVRKKAEKKPKYDAISVANYHEIITDLIGVRALHLIKEDCFRIDGNIRSLWPLKADETPVVYLREGDSELRGLFETLDFQVENHLSGYRSIHYIFQTKPLLRTISFEVQVRTIFEEGWSEIDHKVRYPNFSNNPHINFFLSIFNRLAGSADEMGSLVRQLTQMISAQEAKLFSLQAERDQGIAKIESLIEELKQKGNTVIENQETIKELESEVKKLQSDYSLEKFKNKLSDLNTVSSMNISKLNSYEDNINSIFDLLNSKASKSVKK